MKPLTKFDVLYYLSQIERPEKGELLMFLKRNIYFEDVSERTVSEKLNELKKEGFVKKAKIVFENPKTHDCLAFLYWAKMKDADYNTLLKEKLVLIFRTLFECGSLKLNELAGRTELSKPTLLKHTKALERFGFVSVLKKKPLILKANLNDCTFFYANFLGMGFNCFEKQFSKKEVPKIHSKKLVNAIVGLHVHSTTVTEGNTATEEEVERVLGNYPVSLTPREVTEIINARSAITRLFSICGKDISIEDIKCLHRILMSNLLEKPGEFYYRAKKIAGFKTKLPASKDEIEYGMAALLNFTEKKMNPLVLAPIAHFIFASIHPFADGNGRVARLLHSWILLKAGLPLFIFDPEKRNTYFMLLESARDKSIEEFIDFCIVEHKSSLEKILGKQK
ncbi:MAG: Fic family protein [Candidatus Aenigmarchaeota archaeon]|nr:Fic family protein [Candidatus Aenigmarchaeota archaeon]